MYGAIIIIFTWNTEGVIPIEFWGQKTRVEFWTRALKIISGGNCVKALVLIYPFYCSPDRQAGAGCIGWENVWFVRC
jgi:hypothetical protein